MVFNKEGFIIPENGRRTGKLLDRIRKQVDEIIQIYFNICEKKIAYLLKAFYAIFCGCDCLKPGERSISRRFFMILYIEGNNVYFYSVTLLFQLHTFNNSYK